jgi:hypothetical protein
MKEKYVILWSMITLVLLIMINYKIKEGMNNKKKMNKIKIIKKNKNITPKPVELNQTFKDSMYTFCEKNGEDPNLTSNAIGIISDSRPTVKKINKCYKNKNVQECIKPMFQDSLFSTTLQKTLPLCYTPLYESLSSTNRIFPDLSDYLNKKYVTTTPSYYETPINLSTPESNYVEQAV